MSKRSGNVVKAEAVPSSPNPVVIGPLLGVERESDGVLQTQMLFLC